MSLEKPKQTKPTWAIVSGENAKASVARNVLSDYHTVVHAS